MGRECRVGVRLSEARSHLASVRLRTVPKSDFTRPVNYRKSPQRPATHRPGHLDHEHRRRPRDAGRDRHADRHAAVTDPRQQQRHPPGDRAGQDRPPAVPGDQVPSTPNSSISHSAPTPNPAATAPPRTGCGSRYVGRGGPLGKSPDGVRVDDPPGDLKVGAAAIDRTIACRGDPRPLVRWNMSRSARARPGPPAGLVTVACVRAPARGHRGDRSGAHRRFPDARARRPGAPGAGVRHRPGDPGHGAHRGGPGPRRTPGGR